MMKMDMKKPYGTVFGHGIVAYVQDGKEFDGQLEEVGAPTPAPVPKTAKGKPAAAPSNAETFLLQILKENPLSKSVIYKEVENNNQNWNDIRTAAAEMGIVRYTQNTLEMWRLPENAA